MALNEEGLPLEMTLYSLRPLSRCLQLEELSLPRMRRVGATLDIWMYLPALKKLRRLVFPVSQPEDMESFNLPINTANMEREPTPQLKSIDLGSITIDPEIMFAQPGMELEHGWVCSEMEMVALRLPSISLQIRGQAEANLRTWMTSVYRQLGSLTGLTSLAIECEGPLSLHEPGILQLKSCTELKRLAIGFGPLQLHRE
ncbi:hypothetical protein BGZ95_000696 [Linnemannia exigua]|uniref:Uncharacterized protein n=1 Tax=Linnemannia exigua TaxID=604196 RepID=A0AAD4H9U6_9FUNG|nr:hypothetical protein BGZ95_000696 [Linnemannia exigua]